MCRHNLFSGALCLLCPLPHATPRRAHPFHASAFSVCVFLLVWECVCVCVCVCANVCVHVYVCWVCLCACEFVYVHVCVCVWMCVCSCVSVCACVRVRACVFCWCSLTILSSLHCTVRCRWLILIITTIHDGLYHAVHLSFPYKRVYLYYNPHQSLYSAAYNAQRNGCAWGRLWVLGLFCLLQCCVQHDEQENAYGFEAKCPVLNWLLFLNLIWEVFFQRG